MTGVHRQATQLHCLHLEGDNQPMTAMCTAAQRQQHPTTRAHVRSVVPRSVVPLFLATQHTALPAVHHTHTLSHTPSLGPQPIPPTPFYSPHLRDAAELLQPAALHQHAVADEAVLGEDCAQGGGQPAVAPAGEGTAGRGRDAQQNECRLWDNWALRSGVMRML